MDADLRALVIARDQGRCVRCDIDCDGISHSVHHRQLRKQGGPDSPENLILLHGSGTTGCHALVHSRRADIGEPGGYIVASWEDPAAVPVTYWRMGRCLLTPEGTRVQL